MDRAAVRIQAAAPLSTPFASFPVSRWPSRSSGSKASSHPPSPNVPMSLESAWLLELSARTYSRLSTATSASPYAAPARAGLLILLTLHKLLAHWTQNSDWSPLIRVAVAALFILCAALACTIPALRASSIDPMQAVGYEYLSSDALG
jgi:hypothetical protein